MDLENQLAAFLDESIHDVFSTSVSLSLENLEQYVVDPEASVIVVSISLVGKIEGSISILLTEKCACQIVGKMLGMELEEGSPDAQDGIGEVANMVAGGVKSRFRGVGCLIDIGIPTTLKGMDIHINRSNKLSELEKNFSGEDIFLKMICMYKISEEEASSKEPAVQEKTEVNALDQLSQLMKKAASQ